MSAERYPIGDILVDEQDKILSFSESLGAIGVRREHLGLPWQDTLPGVEEADACNEATPDRRPGVYRFTREDETYDLVMHRQIQGDARLGCFCISVSRMGKEEALEGLALRLDKQATLADLVAGIAHEINNPLTFISGWLQLMLSDGEASGSAGAVDMETLRMLEHEVDRVAKIVSNLLSFARPAPAAQKLVQVDVLLNEVLDLVEYQMRNHSIVIDRRFQPGIPMIPADPSALRQAFLNLVINAKHAMPDGGSLAADVRVMGHEIQIVIQDSGLGIAQEDMAKIFAKGFTTKGDKGGTGLGLPVCRDIIKRHRGAISVVSEKGRGTVFTIRLPLHQEQEREPRARRPSVSDRAALVPSEK